jgi:hypothetical protein
MGRCWLEVGGYDTDGDKVSASTWWDSVIGEAMVDGCHNGERILEGISLLSSRHNYLRITINVRPQEVISDVQYSSATVMSMPKP